MFSSHDYLILLPEFKYDQRTLVDSAPLVKYLTWKQIQMMLKL